MANKGYKGFGGSSKVMKVAGGSSFLSQSRNKIKANEAGLPGQAQTGMAPMGAGSAPKKSPIYTGGK